jgi:FkbM family methyltransferase
MDWDETAEYEISGATIRFPQGLPGRAGASWSRGQFYEQSLLDHARAQGRRGTYVDAGMNAGNHALFFARCCPSTVVLGFEPYPRFLRRAEALFRLNGLRNEVRSFNCALGAEPGSVDLAIRNSRLSAPVLRLDDFALGDLALMKIDVEGMERPVLEGAEKTIRAHRPVLYVEIFDEALDATTDYLDSLGYVRGKRFKSPTYVFKPR